MSAENLNLCEDDEDVVIEGSELHQAMINVGFTNFDLIPKAKKEDIPQKCYVPAVTTGKTWSNKLYGIHRYLFQENSLRKNQLSIILNANILLDDHADRINEIIGDKKKCIFRKFVEWLPFVGSAAGLLAFAVTKRDNRSAALVGAVLSVYACTKVRNILVAQKLKKLVSLQSDLHNSIKYSLKILRRHCKKSIVSELHEKNESIGSEKYKIILEINNLLLEIFESLSSFYYSVGKEILESLPHSLRLNCPLTSIEFEDEKGQNENGYNKLKSWYYTYVLAQSETMFALANIYNGKEQDRYFKIPHKKIKQTVDKLYIELELAYKRLNKCLQTYKVCEIQPVKHVFRGTPSSKWQDVYVHLDITSHRIQLAYKEISSILELLDANSDEDDPIEPITEKMNEAYKQLENARSFAEFSSLLIAKAQRKAITSPETENENLFPVDKDERKIVMVDEDVEIEDEVFEEYIREEYLKPLMESGDGGIIDEFKLDKLLKKNFMSELKDALVDKQRSMSERELKALKRMYERMKRDSSVDKTEPENKTNDIAAPPPPPAPPLPPPTLENRIIAETEEPEENADTPKKSRGPVPLPRVKMLQSNDQMPYVQQFSISECTPNFKFPAFKAVEETFLGSGENSEEEEEENADKTISGSEGEEAEN